MLLLGLGAKEAWVGQGVSDCGQNPGRCEPGGTCLGLVIVIISSLHAGAWLQHAAAWHHRSSLDGPGLWETAKEQPKADPQHTGS